MRPSSVAVGLHCDWLILFDHNSARVCISVPFSKENMACSFETFFSDFTVIKCVDSERTLKNHTKIVGTSHIKKIGRRATSSQKVGKYFVFTKDKITRLERVRILRLKSARVF